MRLTFLGNGKFQDRPERRVGFFFGTEGFGLRGLTRVALRFGRAALSALSLGTAAVMWVQGVSAGLEHLTEISSLSSACSLHRQTPPKTAVAATRQHLPP
jgi:hypothetical protein